MKELFEQPPLFLVNPKAWKLSLAKKQKLIHDIFGNRKREIYAPKNCMESKTLAADAMKPGRLVVAFGGNGFQNLLSDEAIRVGVVIACIPFG